MKGPTQIVREWLKANPGQHPPAAICDALGVALGYEPRKPYYNALAQMFKSGQATRAGSGQHTAYGFLREKTAPKTREQLAENARLRAHVRREARGGRPRAQRLADDAARKAARLEAIAMERAARRAARDASRALKRQESANRQAADSARLRAMAGRLKEDRLQSVARRAALTRAPGRRANAAPAAAGAETIAQFEARGGQVERLPGFEQVKPYTVRPLGRNL